MPEEDPQFWARAHQAQQKLVDQYLDQEDVVLIDIGYESETEDLEETPVVLRIHVRKHWFEVQPDERPTFPDSVDGIPVVVIPGDYRYT